MLKFLHNQTVLGINTEYCLRAKQIKYATFIPDTLSPLIKKTFISDTLSPKQTTIPKDKLALLDSPQNRVLFDYQQSIANNPKQS